MQRAALLAETAARNPRDFALLAVASVAALVLASMDQCTRGPSLTGLFLSNLHTLF
jgi:hypothetical protein